MKSKDQQLLEEAYGKVTGYGKHSDKKTGEGWKSGMKSQGWYRLQWRNPQTNRRHGVERKVVGNVGVERHQPQDTYAFWLVFDLSDPKDKAAFGPDVSHLQAHQQKLSYNERFNEPEIPEELKQLINNSYTAKGSKAVGTGRGKLFNKLKDAVEYADSIQK